MFRADTITVFDTELTSWPGSVDHNWRRPGEHREIIQIGAVKVLPNEDFREIDSFQTYVRPAVNPKLSDYLVNLTGITQEIVDSKGIPFPTALKAFLDFLGETPGEICCNGVDDEVLKENCILNGIPYPMEEAIFINLRPHFAKALKVSGRTAQSSDLLSLAGLSADERSHDALGDAKIITAALRFLSESGRLTEIGPVT